MVDLSPPRPAPATPDDARAPRAAPAVVPDAVAVLVDARGLEISGLGRYTREILRGVLADPRFRTVHLLGDPAALQRFSAGVVGGEKAVFHEHPHPYYSPAGQLAWLRLRRGLVPAVDVCVFPHYDAPLLGLPRPAVVTVHDLIHFKVPEAFARWRRRLAEVLMRRATLSAARVVTVSESSARDLRERFPEVAARIAVVPNGVSELFRPVDARAGLDAGIGGPYLLCVGNGKPHKNLGAAPEVLARLRVPRPALQLVVVGQLPDRGPGSLDHARALGVAERVRHLGPVSDGRLRDLYSAAEALLFPSRYEGFGLPALEAMACGTPVIASNCPSVAEVVAEAGLLFDPDDHAGMASAVERLRAEPGLREELRRRGLGRAEGFRWEDAARRTADLLHGAARGSAAPAGAGADAASAAERAC
jgi:glycosyltransferase involved in cell wall biosynthesis